MTMLSRYTKTNCHFTDDSTASIVRWNVHHALCNLNDIRISLQNAWCKVKKLISRSFPSTSTCQYPQLSPNVKNTVTLPSELIHSSILRMGYKSRFFKALNLPFSAQNRGVQSFYGAKTMGGANRSALVLWVSVRSFCRFPLFRLPCFWVRTIRHRVDGLHVVMEGFDTVFCDVYMTKVAVSNCQKFG